MARTRSIVIGALAVIVVAAMLFAGAKPSPEPVWAAGDTDTEERYIRVSASASVETQPDMVTLYLGVLTTADTASQAASANAAAMDEVIAALKTWGVPDAKIRTRDYSLHQYEEHPPMPRPEGKPESKPITRYRCHNTVVVDTDRIGEVGALIDTAIQAGATNVSGLHFGLKDTDELEKQALREAVAKARGKALTLAQAAGVQVTGVVSIEEQGINWEQPYRKTLMEGAGGYGATTPIQSGEITIHASVTIKFGM